LTAHLFLAAKPFCITTAGTRDTPHLPLFCISTAATWGSANISKVTVADRPPELQLLDSVYRSPGGPFHSCSMGVATARDTGKALPPGYDALIFTTGGVICAHSVKGQHLHTEYTDNDYYYRDDS